MKKYLITILFTLLICIAWGQSPAKYWVQFKDKENSIYSIERPQEFLSERAIQKRQKFNIPITKQDFPVNQSYVDELLAIDKSMIVLTRSKWLNGVTVYSESADIIQKIKALPFVANCEVTIHMEDVEDFDYPQYTYNNNRTVDFDLWNKDLDYGYAFRQLATNNAIWLHRLGAHGESMLMVVMDAGFHNVLKISHFDTLRSSGRLLGVRNFVRPGKTVFGTESHGTNVLSCIAAYKPGETIGSAPMASFYLAQTEDSRSENKIEEDNWVAGIEWADSLGCDVLNSSLGYTKFDDPEAKRSYKDLNGKTSRASQAATIAASKGMIVCNSAGNEGDNEWHYIGSPADAKGIITVGAINYNFTPASFSSYGPTADGRIKPDAVAIGANTVICHDNGKTGVGSGTSFASPLFSGMVACLWQLFPDNSNQDIIAAIRMSGKLGNNESMGYGITDLLLAYNILAQSQDAQDIETLLTYSTTSKSSIKAIFNSTSTSDFTVESFLSTSLTNNNPEEIKKVYSIQPGEKKTLKIKIPKLPKGKDYGLVFIRIHDLDHQTHYTLCLGLEKK